MIPVLVRRIMEDTDVRGDLKLYLCINEISTPMAESVKVNTSER